MNNESINKDELAEQARELKQLLEKYSGESLAAKNVLLRSEKLLNEAIDKNISEPNYKGFFPEEMWAGELVEFEDLCSRAAKFSLLLEGWSSLAEFNKKMSEINSKEQIDNDEKELRKKLQQQ